MPLTGGHKLCLWALILGGLAIIAGCAAPTWVVLEALGSVASFGVWYTCADTPISSTECETYGWQHFSFSDFEVWFYVFHATAGLATLLGIIVVFSSLSKVCGKSESAKGTGVLGLMAGLLAIAAVVVVNVKTSESVMPHGILFADDGWGWAFFVFASGSGLLALFGIVLLAMPNASSPTISPAW
ncbi:uncharacterized protein LOC143292712 isoform X2 [Babylonia areolata]|uniref:uncharacterized protein LOC143292712 isoform X2 n=1 Tax=Babylonia areolata TaxID=304850 RepID=UPI003FD01F55